jgi:hypothetical protein
MGQSQDNVVYMPLTLFKKHVAPTADISIFIKPKGGVEGVNAATDEVRTILRALRKTKFDKDDPFGLVTADMLQALWRNISAGAFLLMILISGISLVVATSADSSCSKRRCCRPLAARSAFCSARASPSRSSRCSRRRSSCRSS